MNPLTPDSDRIEAVVQSLLRAHRGGPAADDQALRDCVTCADDAYAVQDRVVAALGEPAGGPRYWKSGAPSTSQPLKHAPLPSRGVRAAGASLGGLHLRRRWIEAEVALRTGREVGAAEAQRLTPGDAPDLVDGMCVSIEVLDSRWAGGRDAPPLLRQADLLMHAALVLGEFVPFTARAWGRQECHVRVGIARRQSFRGTLGLGDPAFVLPAWMRHATRNGASVPEGAVVSTGTWCGLLDAKEGDLVAIEFPGIGSASVQL